MLEHLPHLVWAPAVMTAAYCGHRVAVRWLDSRERASVAAEARNERESGVVAKFEALEAEMRAFRVDMKAALANKR